MLFKVIKDSRCPVDKPYGIVEESDNELMGCYVSETDAKDQMRGLIVNDPPVMPNSTMSSPAMARNEDEKVRAPIELRNAIVENVDQQQRIITIIAAPYEESGPVMYRGQVWNEVIARGAFDGIDKRPNRIKANRDHDEKRPVGKAINFWPGDERGLLGEVKISKTLLGDETLALADDHVLGLSVGYAAPADNEHTVFDRRSMIRRIKKAYLDHLAFVTNPTWVGAEVLSVRSNDVVEQGELAQTPNLDMLATDEMLWWARELSEKKRAQQGE